MENNICQTCLSKGRRLIPQETLQDILQEINFIKINDKSSGICWECHHIILKYFKFKLQVRQAQESIHIMGQESQGLSSLSTISKNFYDYQFTFHIDPLTNESEIKTDIKLEDVTNAYEKRNDLENINPSEPLLDQKPEINEVTIEVFVDLFNANKKPLNHADNDDVIDNNDSNLNDTEINVSLESPSIICNSDIYVPSLKSKTKLKKERDKKIKESKSKKRKKEWKHDENLKNIICNSDIYVAALKSKRKLRKERDKIIKDSKSKKRKTEKKSKNDEEELKSKFSIIMFNEEEMQKHREEKRNHPNFKKIPYKCDSCVLGFTRKDNLDAHMDKKHNQSFPYTCDVCLTRYAHKRPLARHIGTHFTRYRCALCAYETREMWSALNHCRVKHKTDEMGRLHCPHCDMQTSTQEALSEHIRTHHALYCSECGEKFKGKNTLRTHKSRIHGVKREFICEICSKTFKTKSRLESHAVTHDTATAQKLAYCDTCDVQYKNIYVYRNHLKTSANHSERSYPCPVCKKKFVSKVYWTKHYNFYHLQKSKFNCDICSKMFISDWRLKLHKQTQHGLSRSRNHPCNVCGKKFFTAATLRAHALTHAAARAFLCEACGDTFKQRPALYTHTRLVHAALHRKQ